MGKRKQRKVSSQLKLGTRIEMEHARTIKKFMKPNVKVREVAKHIAKDHLKEDRNYYKKLLEMEKQFKKKKRRK